MTIAELTKLLLEQPQGMMVVVSGYEGGVTEVTSIYQENVYLNQNRAWYFGEHEPTDFTKPNEAGDCTVLHIKGKRH